MVRISSLAFLGILSLCFSYTLGEEGKFYAQEGDFAKIIFVVRGSSTGVKCEYPGRPHLTSKARSARTSIGANVVITNVQMEDAGPLICYSSTASESIELVVYNETSEVQDIQAEAVSGNQISLSWSAPLKYPELVIKYFIIIYDQDLNKIITTERIQPISDTGFEKHVVDKVSPGPCKIVISAYYKTGQSNRDTRGPQTSYYITEQLWSGPELSIRAAAIASGTVLVSLEVLDSENVTDLQTSYSDGSSKNWTDFEMDTNERFAILNDLEPQATYFFKAKAVLRLGVREVVTHVVTPRSATPAPSNVVIQLDDDSSFGVMWKQESSSSVKGYTVTVEEQQADKSYRIHTEKTTTAQDVIVGEISTDLQYRVTVRNFDLNGLGASSEAVLFPDVPETATPAECPTPAPDFEPLVDPIAPEETVPTEQSDTSYSLDVRVVKQTPTRLRIMWFLPRGDLDKVDRFQIVFTSNAGRKLIDSKLRKNQRSISLRPVSPNTSYTLTVKALDAAGNVLVTQDVPVAPDSSEGDSSEPELLVDVSEIRDKQARLAWSLKNVDSSELKSIRLSVHKDGPDGPQVLKRTLSSDKQTILLAKLPARSVFYILVETIGQDDEPFLSSALTLVTPGAGEIGEPVSGSPLPTKPAFTKAVGQLKIISVRLRGEKATVTWEDDGLPIPRELTKDVRVIVQWAEISNGEEGTRYTDISDLGATSFEITGLKRYSEYSVRAKYFSDIPGVEKIIWSIPRKGREMV